MKVRTLSLAVATSLMGTCLLTTSPAHALGFGSPVVQSNIFQPLKVEVELRLSEGETFSDVGIQQAPVLEYDRQGVPFTQALSSLRVSVQQQGGRAFAVVTTTQPVNTPAAQFILQSLSSQGKVLKTFSVLLSSSAMAGPTATESVGRAKAAAAKLASLQADQASQSNQSNQLSNSAIIALKSKNQSKESTVDSIYLSIIEVGNRPPSQMMKRVTGSSDSEPLAKALSKIVPPGWKGFAGDASMKAPVMVSWSGDSRLWISVLDQLLAQRSMNATLDWDRKEVTFRGTREAEQLRLGDFESRSEKTPGFSGSMGSVGSVESFEYTESSRPSVSLVSSTSLTPSMSPALSLSPAAPELVQTPAIKLITTPVIKVVQAPAADQGDQSRNEIRAQALKLAEERQAVAAEARAKAELRAKAQNDRFDAEEAQVLAKNTAAAQAAASAAVSAAITAATRAANAAGDR